eukprot:jgi/Hompol1/518/HPOL_001515-RA
MPVKLAKKAKQASANPAQKWKRVQLPRSKILASEDSLFLSLEEIEPVGTDADGLITVASSTNPDDEAVDAAKDTSNGYLLSEDAAEIEDIDEDLSLFGLDPASFVHVDAFTEDDIKTAATNKKSSSNDPTDKKGSKASKTKKERKQTTELQALKRISSADTPLNLFNAATSTVESDADADAEIQTKETDAAIDDNGNTSTADSPASNLKLLNVDNIAVPSDSPWLPFGLHPLIVKTLHKLGFEKPTDIQSQTLAQALVHHKDVIGAAQTTLAFGLPVLHHIASQLELNKELSCVALIITPTRELAMQSFIPTLFKIVSVVGGMSQQKQKRQISRKPHIIIGTPGRLWELIQERSRFLIIDEADRMLEAGHFKDLDEILAAISTDRLGPQGRNIKRRTMVFSATMLEDAAIKLKVSQSNKAPKFGSTLFGKLLEKVNFRDPHPVYINLTTKNVMASGLLEAKVNCLKTEKDHMLYYVLCRYPGKTIVFVNSIDAIRRLVPILTILKIQVYGLHAEMQQKQRLKNLDRFRESTHAVLIASDVASRGLDIPLVDHVIHYQIPRAADIYVHRSGRTARANTEGISVSLCSPEEMQTYKKLCYVLGKTNGMQDFPIDLSVLTAIKRRIQIAKEIDSLQHKAKKIKNDRDWFRKAAEEADILLSDDEDNFGDASSKTHSKNKKKSGKAYDDEDDGGVDGGSDQILSLKERNRIQSLKNELDALLARQLVQKGISGKYLTSNTIEGLPELLMRSQGGH